MEATNVTQPQNQEPKSFQLYTGKAPIALQIIGGLMWLGGLGLIISGIPLLIIFGVGIIPIILGVFTIKYARGLFKMQKKAYKGALILTLLTLAAAIGSAAINVANLKQSDIIQLVGSLLYVFIVLFYLQKYKDRFVN